MSILLLLGAVQGAVTSVGLFRKRTNRSANRLLAVLVFILTLKLVPYVIGYAGFYAAYPWLDLAPFDLGLGIGPLIYLYVSRIARATLPNRWKAHLIPVVLQLLVYAVLFVQPLGFKNWFEDHIGPAFNRTENTLEVASICVYLWLTWRRFLEYERRLAKQSTVFDARRVKHLRTMLILLSATLCGFVGAKLWGLFIREVSYFQMFPFYVLLMLVVYAFGFTAFQFAETEFPAVVDGAAVDLAPPNATDWPLIAAGFTERLGSSSIWKDPLLSVAAAAEALDTSEGRLSRAINSGLQITFSEWINHYRIEQVAAKLASAPPEQPILAIAFECGFNSKATFHRWFRLCKGCTPSEYRSTCRRAAGLVQARGPDPPQCPRPME